MSYKTNRYIKNTFGIVPEVRLGKKMTYLVENKKLTITSWSGVPKIIPLTESTSVDPLTDKGMFGTAQGAMGFGDVVIKNSSGEHKIEGLKNIREFINAIYFEIGTLNENDLNHTTKPQTNIQSSEDLLQLAVLKGRTGFGETNTVTEKSENKVKVLETSFNINGDGTLTDLTNRLQWIQAPWGMVWNGDTFKGTPISIDWRKATSLFGKGTKVKGWKQDGTDMGVLKPDLMDASEKHNGYEKGSCIIEFAGHNDWRLPTCVEFHKTMFFSNDPFNRREIEQSVYDLLNQIFVNVNNHSFWTANEREYPNASWAEKLLSKTMKSSGVAWKARASYGNINDDSTDLKYSVLFVREIK